MDRLRQPSPLRLTGNVSSNWKAFVRKYEYYAIAVKLTGEDEKIQCATFLSIAGEECQRLLETMTIPTGDQNKIAPLKKLFEDYCSPRNNVIYNRFLFNSRSQREGESSDAFVTSLRMLAKECDYLGVEESLIRDRLVCGVADDALRASMLRKTDLKLSEAIDMCRLAETSAKTLRLISSEEPKEVQKVAYRTNRKSRMDDIFDCNKCGRKHQFRSCPAFGKDCLKCGRKNHFAVKCRNSSDQSIRQIEMKSEVNEDKPLSVYEYDLGTLEVNNCEASDEWTVVLLCNGKHVKVEIDTGAKANIISEKTLSKIDTEKPLKRVTWVSHLIAFFGEKKKSNFKVFIPIRFNNRDIFVEFIVISEDVKTLICGKTACQLQLITKINDVTSQQNSASLKDHILARYPDCFQGLGCFSDKHRIVIDETVEPRVCPPRRVPFSIRDRFKAKLDELEEQGIITKVNHPTDWCSPLVNVVKGDKLRICLDPLYLNAAVKRQHFAIETFDSVLSRVNGSKVFSVLDLSQGFLQIPLDEESSNLCTFATIFGRYRFKRLPFGLKSSPEVFQMTMSRIFGNINGVIIYIDDLLIFAKTTAEHDKILEKVLQVAQAKGLVFNLSKLQLRVTSIKYLGHIFSANGVTADPAKIEIIKHYKEPTDKESLRRYFGFVQFLGRYVENMSNKTASLRKMLSASEFQWTDKESKVFKDLNNDITRDVTLRYYDVAKEVTLSVDSSSFGMGAVILQEGKPVAFGSRSLSPTEQRYAQIEKEMLAVVFGVQKFHEYLFARFVTVQTDHRPLVSIFSKEIDKLSPRLQRMRLKLLCYDLKIIYTPGKCLHVADALSRDCIPSNESSTHLDLFSVNIPKIFLISVNGLELLKKNTMSDEVLKKIIEYTSSRWPAEKKHCSTFLQPYWQMKEKITVVDGIIFVDNKILVPLNQREEVLKRLHDAHLGVNKTKERARDTMFWPGMTSDIERMVQKCKVCLSHRKLPAKEPLETTVLPSYPWKRVAIDLFDVHGSHLICVDYYSKYPEIVTLNQTSSAHVITALKQIFARHGIPEELVSDNGRQFVSVEFEEFMSDWDIKQITSSPHYPQSNGQAERAIQTVKLLLKKAREGNNDPHLALLNYRATTLIDLNYSPSQLLMNRRLRTRVPLTENQLKPEVPANVDRNHDEYRRQLNKYYNRSSQNLPSLGIGSSVLFRKDGKWIPAIVLRLSKFPRSYVLKSNSGSLFRRNRRQIIVDTSVETSGDNSDSALPDGTQQESHSPGFDTNSNTSASGSTSRIPRYNLRSREQRRLPNFYQSGFN